MKFLFFACSITCVMNMEITATQILGFIFVVAGLVLLFMNIVGVIEGIASLALLFIGLYFTGILK